MMYEYKTLFATSPPTAQQLADFGKEGWLLVQIVPFEGQLLLYFVRDAQN